MEQHQVIAVVVPRFPGVVLHEGHVEARVREALADKPVLSKGLMLIQVVFAQPNLVLAGGREGDGRSERRQPGRLGRV